MVGSHFDIPNVPDVEDEEAIKETIYRRAKELFTAAEGLSDAAQWGRLHDVDRWREIIATKLDVLESLLAPNGRHAPCGQPLDEDGECPSWCDQ